MKKDFGFIFWLHLFLIFIILLSPLWLDWKLILVGIILLQSYWLTFGGCHLTKIEAGEGKDNTFYYHYLSKIFPALNKRRVKYFVRYILPLVILVLAALIQDVYTPLVSF